MRLLSAILLFAFISWETVHDEWIIEKHKGYNLVYTTGDKSNKDEYNKLVENGMVAVKAFFGSSCKKEFNIYIHPDRHSLNSTWQKDWKMPEFKSECWMVASGVAERLDMISPKTWDKQACEHNYANAIKTQQVITHELVHVYHGQLNASPDFSNTEGIDWFVEGLATYASGQCDSARIAEVKKAIQENKVPKSLDDFWKGKLKYGLSGAFVMYIDKTYKRTKLKELLPLDNKAKILSALNTTEDELLAGWKKYITDL